MRPSDEANLDPVVRRLIRELVARLVDGRPPLLPGSGQVEHLVDVEVDGVRCRVVRMAPSQEAPAALSPREREIARMVAKGYTNLAIAGVLGISAWTVSTHLRRIFAKLGVNSRAAMVAGVLDSDRWPADVSPVHATPTSATHDCGSPEDATHDRGSSEDATARRTADPVVFG